MSSSIRFKIEKRQKGGRVKRKRRSRGGEGGRRSRYLFRDGFKARPFKNSRSQCSNYHIKMTPLPPASSFNKTSTASRYKGAMAESCEVWCRRTSQVTDPSQLTSSSMRLVVTDASTCSDSQHHTGKYYPESTAGTGGVGEVGRGEGRSLTPVSLLTFCYRTPTDARRQTCTLNIH